MTRLSSSRTWISRSGPQARRRTILRFVLSEPAVVEFVVIRVAPDCRRVGRFRVQGRAGVNRVPFRGRVNGRALPPGTYRIRARPVNARGRLLAETRLVIFRHKPLPGEVAAARSSDTCSRGESRRESSGPGGGAASPVEPGARGAGVLRVEGRDKAGAAADDRAGKLGSAAGVLGARFTRAADAVKKVHPILFVLLGIAIGLLAIAALPMRYVPHDRMAVVLAYRRSAVALVGATALVAVSVLYALA
ncbi:MAG: hypothetical protein ACRDKU_02795 [Gaiellaceae bacterium]